MISRTNKIASVLMLMSITCFIISPIINMQVNKYSYKRMMATVDEIEYEATDDGSIIIEQKELDKLLDDDSVMIEKLRLYSKILVGVGVVLLVLSIVIRLGKFGNVVKGDRTVENEEDRPE